MVDRCDDMRYYGNQKKKCGDEFIVICIVPLLPLVLSDFTSNFPWRVLINSRFTKYFFLVCMFFFFLF